MNRRYCRMLARKLRTALGRFQGDEQGSITIQVIIFSLLLLLSTGLVLDSGRVFTQHSQMQAYTDQMALAAANELDGQADSITRAVNAIFGANGSTPYLQKAGIEVGVFEVENVGFYSVMEVTSDPQPNMTGAFPSSNLLAIATVGSDGTPTITYAGGDGEAENAARAALYAVVGARQVETRSATTSISRILLTMGNDPKPGTGLPGNLASAPENLGFSAVAAASLSGNSCAEMSNLVFCNPWEDVDPSPLDVAKTDPTYSVPGRSLLYFAPNFANPAAPTPVVNGKTEFNSIYEWDVNHQLFTLASPLVDAGAVCSEANVPRLFDDEEYVVARDRCLMARSQVDQACWTEDRDLRIAPAHGPSVSRAINTKFDIWMEPFTSAIANTATMPGTGLGYHQFFEPDILATTLFELGDWYTEPGTDADGNPTGGAGTVQDGDPTHEYDFGGVPFVRYLGHTVPAWGYNINTGVYASGITFDICHANSYREAVGESPPGSACVLDFIGDHYAGATSVTAYPSTYMQQYWSNMYQVTALYTASPNQQNPNFCGTNVEELIPGVADFCEVAQLPGGIDTWYKVYQRERSLLSELDTIDNYSRVAGPSGRGEWCGTDNAPTGGCAIDYQSRYGVTATEAFIKHTPMDYFGITGETTLFAANAERRRMRAAMVNCSATIANGAGADGTYQVALDDLRLMDFYIPGPASHFCGPNIPGCTVDNSRETLLFVETIEDHTEEISRHYTAHLVR